MTDSTKPQTQHDKQNLSKEDIAHIELLEERAVVNKERIQAGQVHIQKHIRTKTVNVPVELTEEVLTITTTWSDEDAEAHLSRNGSLNDIPDADLIQVIDSSEPHSPILTINGETIPLTQDAIDIVISRQVATVSKQTFAVEDIHVEKSTNTITKTVPIELQHEELDIDEQGFLHTENTPNK